MGFSKSFQLRHKTAARAKVWPSLRAAASFAVEALESRWFLSGGTSTPALGTAGTIGGAVYGDPTGQGWAGTPMAGQRVYLDLQGVDVLTAADPIATTDANGQYVFSNLAAGNYLVRPVPQNGQVTTEPVWGGKFFVQLGAGQTVAGNNFLIESITTPTASLSNGQRIVSGTINGQATLSRFNADGSTDTTYGNLGTLALPGVQGQATSIVGLPDGTFLATYPNQTVLLDATGAIRSTGGPGAIPPVAPPTSGATISGTLYDDANDNHLQDAGENGIAGQQVYLDLQGVDALTPGDPIATTDANGVYTFSGLAAGNYLVRPVPQGGQVTTTPIWGGKYFVQLAQNQTVAGDDFGIQTVSTRSYSINGQLYVSGVSNGLDTLTRYNSDGSLDVFHGALGVVTLPNTVSGQPTSATAVGGTVVFTYPGQTVTLDGAGGIVSIVANGVAVTGGAAISGTVTDATSGIPVAGRQVYLDLQGIGTLAPGDPVVTTDATGNYSFTSLTPTNYLVRLVPQAGQVIAAPIWGGKFFIPLAANQTASGNNFVTRAVAGPSVTLAGGQLLVGSGNTVARYNPDGSVDTTFGTLGVIDAVLTNQPDGTSQITYPDGSHQEISADGTIGPIVPDAPAAASVLSYHNGPSDDGQDSNETLLTPANVNAATFGKLFSTPLDGQVFAQPLCVPGVNITAGSQLGSHNVTFAATEHDSVYAINADDGSVLWQASFINPAAGVTTIPAADTGTAIIAPEIGITSTPVIDPATNTIYVVAATKEVIAGQNHYILRLHALDLGSGAEKFGGPAVIADTIYDGTTYTPVSGPSVAGTGDGNINGVVTYNVIRQLQRSALALVNGVVYFSSASFSDIAPFHGWLLGYKAADLSLAAVFNATPNGSDGGIWEAGAGISTDAAGNIYLVTGNGTFDTTFNPDGTPSQGDYGDAVLKLVVDPTSTAAKPNINGYGLKVVDYFVPQNAQELSDTDKDLGSSGVLILPDSAGSAAHPHLLLISGKNGDSYLLDRDHLGGFDANNTNAIQVIPNDASGLLSSAAYFNGSVYFAGYRDTGQAYAIANAALSAAPTSVTGDTFGYPGATPSISDDAGQNPIVWTLNSAFNRLQAYAANDLSDELFTSDQATDGRDQLGTAVKFTVPTIANGKVFVGTSNALVTYGLLRG